MTSEDSAKKPAHGDLVFSVIDRMCPAPPPPDRTGRLLAVEDLDPSVPGSSGEVHSG